MLNEKQKMKQAIDNEDKEAVKQLLDSGFDLSITISEFKTAINYASTKGKDSIVKFIAENYKDNYDDTYQFGSALLDYINRGKTSLVKILLKAGAKKDWSKKVTNYYGLHLAVLNSDFKMVEILVSHSEYLNKKDKDKKIPLSLAFTIRNWKIIYLILKTHVTQNISAEDIVISELLSRTIKECKDKNLRIEIIECLIQLDNRNSLKGNYLKSVLEDAIKSGDEDVVNLLLKESDHSGVHKTAFQLALMHPESAIFESIITKFSGKLSQNEKQESLLTAIGNGLFTEVSILLNNGAEINGIECSSLQTPLHCAVAKNNAAMVRMLLRNGADQSILNGDNEAPIEIACKKANDEVINALLEDANFKLAYQKKPCITLPSFIKRKSPNLNLLKKLLENGANINEQDPITGNTALHCAAELPNCETLPFVLQYDPDPSLKTALNESAIVSAHKTGRNTRLLIEKYGNQFEYLTPAEKAIEDGNFYILEQILKQDKSICLVTSNRGSHLLGMAIYQKQPKMVTLLLEFGANPEERTLHGKTMEEYAGSYGLETECYRAIVEFKKKFQEKCVLDDKLLESEEHFSKIEGNGITLEDLPRASIAQRQLDTTVLLLALKKINERVAFLKTESVAAHHLKQYESLLKIGNYFANDEIMFSELAQYIKPLQKCKLPEVKYLLNFILHMQKWYEFKSRIKEKVDDFKKDIAATKFQVKNILRKWVDGKPSSIVTLEELIQSLEKKKSNDRTGYGSLITLLAEIVKVFRATTDSNRRHDTTVAFYKKWETEFTQLRFTERNKIAASELEEISLLDINSSLSSMSPVWQADVLVPEKISHPEPLSQAYLVSNAQPLNSEIQSESHLYPVVKAAKNYAPLNKPLLYPVLEGGSTKLLQQGLGVFGNTNAVVESLSSTSIPTPSPSVIMTSLAQAEGQQIPIVQKYRDKAKSQKPTTRYTIPADEDAKISANWKEQEEQSGNFAKLIQQRRANVEDAKPLTTPTSLSIFPPLPPSPPKDSKLSHEKPTAKPTKQMAYG